MKKIINFINGFNIINIFIIILYYFKSTRNFVRTIIEALLNEKIVINLNVTYIKILPVLKHIMYIYIIVLIVCFIFRTIRYYFNRKCQRNKVSKLQGIDKELYNYINNDERKCFVITGDWGVGKTYTIDNFFDKYCKYEKRNIYRISCFGMENRKDVLDELKNIFEKQDNSIMKHIINVLNKIPIIGDLLEDALKSDYEFKDLKEKSIFVFDDFERINIPKYENKYIRDIYRVKNIKNNAREILELRDIYKELENIEKAFKQYDNSIQKIEDNNRLQRYNVITGIINELIERYNMKIIVICNKREIDNIFFNDIFECKIESIFYKIESSSKITYQLADRNIRNRVSLKVELKEKLLEFFKENSLNIDKVWKQNAVNNVRILSKSISAFIDLIENSDIKEKYYRDLFYTILLTHIAIFTKQTDNVKLILKGELVKSFYEKHIIMSENKIESDALIESIISEPALYDIRWMGLDIGSAWSVGIHNYKSVELELNEYNDYNYLDEYRTFYLNQDIVLEKNRIYKFDDLIYLLKINWNNKTKVDNILKIIEEGEIDYITHTSFRYGSRIFADIYGNDKATKTETIFSIMMAYNLEDEILIKVFEKIKNKIDIQEIDKSNNKIGMQRINAIKEKYIKYLEENKSLV